MLEVNYRKKLRRRLPRVAMKILDRILEESVGDEGMVSRLKIYGISASLFSRNEFHDYAGRDYTAYYLIIRRGNRIVLDIEIDKWLDNDERFINVINKYVPRGWEWRILRAA